MVKILAFIITLALFFLSYDEFTSEPYDHYFYWTGSFDDALYLEKNNEIVVFPYVVWFNDDGHITYGNRIPRIECNLGKSNWYLSRKAKFFYLNRRTGFLEEYENEKKLYKALELIGLTNIKIIEPHFMGKLNQLQKNRAAYFSSSRCEKSKG